MKRGFEYLLIIFTIFIIGLNFISAVPSFASVPANASLTYGDSLSATFNGNPNNASFGSYYINNTGSNVVFSINQSGANATLINNAPLAAGSYAINVTINDSDGKIAWVTFTVQVSKSQEKCQVLFDISSPRIFPTTFVVWTNCTTPFALYRNGTVITNNSVQTALAVGAYNFSLFRNDTANYSFVYNYSQYIILPDTTLPTYTENKSVSTTEIAKVATFATKINDNSSLETAGGYIFSINQTGAWVNDTLVNFTVTPSWANVTKLLNSTVGTYIGFRWFFNDTSSNLNSTPIFTFTTTADATSPTYSDEDLSTLLAGKVCDFTINVTDNIALGPNGRYIFSTDNSGSWVNETAVNFTAISEIASASKRLNSDVGEEVSYRWFFSDNTGNTASSSIYTITTTDGFNSGNSGSAGTTAKTTPTTYSTDEQFSGNGEEYTLNKYDKVSFAVGSTSHSLTVKAVGATLVKVEIASTPMLVSLQKGILYEFDVTGDAVNDLKVRYDGLSGVKAIIFMQEIKKVTTPPVQEEVASPPAEESGNSVPEETVNTPTVNEEKEGILSSSAAKIILIIIVVILVIIIIASLAKKKQKKKRYLMYGY